MQDSSSHPTCWRYINESIIIIIIIINYGSKFGALRSKVKVTGNENVKIVFCSYLRQSCSNYSAGTGKH